MSLPGLQKYSLSGDSARSLTPPGAASDALLIKALKPGFSDLWVWKLDGSSEHRSIQVDKPRTAREAPPALEKALSRLTETEILWSADGATLRGELTSLREAARVAVLAQSFKEIRDETTASPSLLDTGQTRLERWLTEAKLGERLRVERLGQSVWVRGSLPAAAEEQAVRRQIRAVFPRAEIELSSLPDGAPTVHFKVYLLEVRRTRFGNLGLSWPSTIPGAFQVDLGAIREAVRLELAIQSLEGEGSARVLSNPELVVRAPGEAELFAGGEIPVRATSRFRSDVTWKPYGLTLKLKVTHAAGDRVRLEVSTEVSHLNPQVVDDPIPGLQSNRMRTQVDARFGEPLLLSGLLQEGMRDQARGLPVLRRLPILGKLFGSEDYLNERSELVAILVPRSSPPPAPRMPAASAPLPEVMPPLKPLDEEVARPTSLAIRPHLPAIPFTRGGAR